MKKYKVKLIIEKEVEAKHTASAKTKAQKILRGESNLKTDGKIYIAVQRKSKPKKVKPKRIPSAKEIQAIKNADRITEIIKPHCRRLGLNVRVLPNERLESYWARACGGRCIWRIKNPATNRMIKINPRKRKGAGYIEVGSKKMTDLQIRDLAMHELAHVQTDVVCLYAIPHGREWQDIYKGLLMKEGLKCQWANPKHMKHSPDKIEEI